MNDLMVKAHMTTWRRTSNQGYKYSEMHNSLQTYNRSLGQMIFFNKGNGNMLLQLCLIVSEVANIFLKVLGTIDNKS